MPSTLNTSPASLGSRLAEAAQPPLRSIPDGSCGAIASTCSFGASSSTLPNTSHSPITPTSPTSLRAGSITNFSTNSSRPSGREAATREENTS